MHTSRRGNIIVDAACVLPVFILAIGMLLSLITQAGSEEKTVGGLKTAAIAAIDVSAVYPYELTESEKVSDGLYVDNVIRLMLPGERFLKGIAFRPFVGESKQPEGADDMQVYIFPKYGVRYHIDGCYILKRETHIRVLKSQAVADGYTPCRICLGGEAGSE
ncbi:MAG: hypothetical protein II971_04465 [Firmicutes bacterium]|nr:hypothetical protein [Bacillota bacterium]